MTWLEALNAVGQRVPDITSDGKRKLFGKARLGRLAQILSAQHGDRDPREAALQDVMSVVPDPEKRDRMAGVVRDLWTPFATPAPTPPPELEPLTPEDLSHEHD